MLKSNVKRYVVEGIFALVLIIFSMVSYIMTKSLSVAEEKSVDYTYVSSEILTNAIPVIQDDTQYIIERPYSEENIKIVKYFYDASSSKEEQEKSIFYYENTYIQNTGVDYGKEEVFSVQAVLDGIVLSVIEDDINGASIKV